MGTNNFAYRYDPIGNRTVATNNGAVTEFLANSLNQYSQITNNQPPITILPAYDLDGNLATNGAWAFAWDAENRLVSASSNGLWVVGFTYDYMSRRVSKMTASATNTFIYDGWNLISELNSTVTNHFVWGLDLSGTLQGAGGIGGLLATTIQQPGNSSTVFPLCDANGNITDYVTGDGSLVAHYEYDPFGNIIAKSGILANLLAFRFSTKYTDSETGLVYYGYRYYQPETGRWASRDPMEERGGGNLYVLLANQPINRRDFLGLCDCFNHLTGTPPPGGFGEEAGITIARPRSVSAVTRDCGGGKTGFTVTIEPLKCIIDIYYKVYTLSVVADEYEHVACFEIHDKAIDSFKSTVEPICECPAKAVELYNKAVAVLNKAVKSANKCNTDLDAPGGPHGW